MNAAVTDVRPVALKALVLSTTEAQEERRARFDKAALGELAKKAPKKKAKKRPARSK